MAACNQESKKLFKYREGRVAVEGASLLGECPIPSRLAEESALTTVSHAGKEKRAGMAMLRLVSCPRGPVSEPALKGRG